MNYRINEMFDSIQGEGILAGRSASFIRMQGCPVHCTWCDTKYTWSDGGTVMTVPDILAELGRNRLVVITGGEPLMQDLDRLMISLHSAGMQTQIETSGYCLPIGRMWPMHLTWSPKPALKWHADDEIKKRAREVKWVVDGLLTFETVYKEFENIFFGLRNIGVTFVLMPEGNPPKGDFVDMALKWLSDVPPEHQMVWRFGDRMHTRLGIK